MEQIQQLKEALQKKGEILTTIQVFRKGVADEIVENSLVKHVGYVTSYTVTEDYITVWFKDRYDRVNIPRHKTHIEVF